MNESDEYQITVHHLRTAMMRIQNTHQVPSPHLNRAMIGILDAIIVLQNHQNGDLEVLTDIHLLYRPDQHLEPNE